MKNKLKTIFVAIPVFFLGVASLYLVYYFFPNMTQKTIINKQEKEVTVTDAGIADAVDKIYDAVVVVENYKKEIKVSSGTGFVYKKSDGKAYILTNNHVVSGADSVMVTFPTKEKVNVEVIGSDIYYDLAVMTVSEEKAKQVAKTGSSMNLRLGDTVFTVGAPLANEYSGTVTRGIVSGKDRLVPVSVGNPLLGADYIMRVIQTDASINSGNSGGPLSNSNGEVVGITSLKLISSGVEGMGFAIPIEDAIHFASIVEKGGKIIRPTLGISIADIQSQNIFNPSSSNQYVDEGAEIVEIIEGYPAADGGLKTGDVIIKMDDNIVSSVASLKYNLYKHNLNETAKIIVNRDGKEIEFNIKLDKAME